MYDSAFFFFYLIHIIYRRNIFISIRKRLDNNNTTQHNTYLCPGQKYWGILLLKKFLYTFGGESKETEATLYKIGVFDYGLIRCIFHSIFFIYPFFHHIKTVLVKYPNKITKVSLATFALGDNQSTQTPNIYLVSPHLLTQVDGTG